jgi:glucose-1-phosphatase
LIASASDRPGELKRSSVLLFDLGGVLVRNKAFSSLRSMVGGAVDDDKLRERWLRSPAVRSFELGQISPTAFAEGFVEEWKVQLTPEAVLLDVAAWIEEPYEGSEELMARLRVSYHVSCLSNCNELHWSNLGPFLECFDSAFSSHLLGEVKPDESAFRAVMNALEVEPGQVRFFDDARSNVEAARRLGIDSFLVGGIDDVRRIVEKEGLL